MRLQYNHTRGRPFWVIGILLRVRDREDILHAEDIIGSFAALGAWS